MFSLMILKTFCVLIMLTSTIEGHLNLNYLVEYVSLYLWSNVNPKKIKQTCIKIMYNEHTDCIFLRISDVMDTI